MKRRIGVVEDDETLCRELVYFLESNGYDAVKVESKDYSKDSILNQDFHLLLLDISLPDTDGLILCKEIRKQSDIPIIMITSNNSEITELMSMNYGADDFLSKPIRPQLLIAHMEAIIKRAYKETDKLDEVDLGQYKVFLRSGIIQSSKGQQELTKNEIKILVYLIKNRGNIVTREALMNELWENYLFVDDNTLTVNMTRLRSKMEEIGLMNQIITKRGMGYQLK